MDPVKGLLLSYLMPESCYDEFFLNFNFLDGENPEDDRKLEQNFHCLLFFLVIDGFQSL